MWTSCLTNWTPNSKCDLMLEIQYRMYDWMLALFTSQIIRLKSRSQKQKLYSWRVPYLLNIAARYFSYPMRGELGHNINRLVGRRALLLSHVLLFVQVPLVERQPTCRFSVSKHARVVHCCISWFVLTVDVRSPIYQETQYWPLTFYTWDIHSSDTESKIRIKKYRHQ